MDVHGNQIHNTHSASIPPDQAPLYTLGFMHTLGCTHTLGYTHILGCMCILACTIIYLLQPFYCVEKDHPDPDRAELPACIGVERKAVSQMDSGAKEHGGRGGDTEAAA